MKKTPIIAYIFITYSLFCLTLALALSHNSAIALNYQALSTLPDFVNIEHTAARKQAFFNYLRPAIQQQNKHILWQRRRLIEWQERQNSNKQSSLNKLSQSNKLQPPNKRQRRTQQRWLTKLARHYRVDPQQPQAKLYRQLLIRVDAIPAAMVLAQAALESGWGRSRFAREANNLFGQWCYTKGCGLVPKQRNSEAKHFVSQFDTVDDSIAAYMLNINSHRAYRKVRKIRAAEHSAGRQPRAYAMVAGLSKYSSRGEAYIKELRTLIQGNNLENF